MSGSMSVTASAVARHEAEVPIVMGLLRGQLLREAPMSPISTHVGRIGDITDLEGVFDVVGLSPSQIADIREIIDRAGPDGWLCVAYTAVPEAVA